MLKLTPYVKAFESYRLTDIQTDVFTYIHTYIQTQPKLCFDFKF